MNHNASFFYHESLNALGKKAPLLKTLLSLSSSLELKKSFVKIPEEDSSELLKKIKEKDPITLFIYGISSASFYEKIYLWLHEKKERRLLFFEEDLSQIYHFLSTKEGLELVKDVKVDLFYLKAPHFWDQHSKYLQSRLYDSFEIISLKNSEPKFLHSFESFKEKVVSISLNLKAILSEYLNVSPTFYKNAFQNFEKLSQSYMIHSLFNKFHQIPAIICGAGPSINEAADILKNLSNKAIIFSGGNALSALNTLQIKPHFSVGIDPYDSHLVTYSQNNFFELPLIYRTRMQEDAVEKAHGELLYTPKAIGYPLIEWFEERLGIKSPLIEEGQNVVNFSLQLATQLGCNPIILVGCDLSYCDQNSYSSACLQDSTLPEEGSLSSSDFSINKGCYKKNALGEDVYTLWKWVEEAMWMEAFAQDHPHTHFINSNPSGLKVSNFTALRLPIIEKLFLKKEYDIESLIHLSILESPLVQISTKTLHELFLELNKSLDHVIKLLQKIQREPLCDGKTLLLEEDLKKEVAYDKMLQKLSDLFEGFENEKDHKKRKQKRAAFLLSYANVYSEVLSNSFNST